MKTNLGISQLTTSTWKVSFGLPCLLLCYWWVYLKHSKLLYRSLYPHTYIYQHHTSRYQNQYCFIHFFHNLDMQYYLKNILYHYIIHPWSISNVFNDMFELLMAFSTRGECLMNRQLPMDKMLKCTFFKKNKRVCIQLVTFYESL